VSSWIQPHLTWEYTRTEKILRKSSNRSFSNPKRDDVYLKKGLQKKQYVLRTLSWKLNNGYKPKFLIKRRIKGFHVTLHSHKSCIIKMVAGHRLITVTKIITQAMRDFCWWLVNSNRSKTWISCGYDGWLWPGICKIEIKVMKCKLTALA
jgi:hypothetical protein